MEPTKLLARAWKWARALRPDREERLRARYYIFELLEANLPRAEEGTTVEGQRRTEAATPGEGSKRSTV